MSYETKQTVTLLETGEASSLVDFRAGRLLVLDFWHTRCVRCPEALTKLDQIAGSGKHDGVAFAACALSLGEGSMEQTQELLEDEWESLTHLFMSTEEKELAKAEFGFSAVPFCVVFAADGSVLYKGDPKGINFTTVFDVPEVEPVAPKAVAAGLTSPDSVAALLTEVNGEMPAAMPPIGGLVLDEDF